MDPDTKNCATLHIHVHKKKEKFLAEQSSGKTIVRARYGSKNTFSYFIDKLLAIGLGDESFGECS